MSKAAKRRQARREAVGPTKKQIRLSRREAQQRRLILLFTVVVTVLVVGILGFGLLNEQVIKPRQPVAIADGEEISTTAFQARVRFARLNLIAQLRNIYQQAQDPQLQAIFQSYMQSLLNQLNDPTQIGRDVLNQMIDEVLIRHEANRRGITVSAEEVQERLEQQFGFYRHGTPTPTATATATIAPTATATPLVTNTPTPLPSPTGTLTPTATLVPTAVITQTATPFPTFTPFPTPTVVTEEGFKQLLAQQLELWRSINFTEADYRKLVEAELYDERLRELFNRDGPTREDHIMGAWIAFETEEGAKAALDRLNSGEPFDKLAAEVRARTIVSATTGELPWTPVVDVAPRFGDEVQQAVSSTAAGQHTNVIAGSGNLWYIFNITGHEQRDLDPQTLHQRQTDHFQQWLDGQRSTKVQFMDYWESRVPQDPAVPLDLVNAIQSAQPALPQEFPTPLPQQTP